MQLKTKVHLWYKRLCTAMQTLTLVFQLTVTAEMKLVKWFIL